MTRDWYSEYIQALGAISELRGTLAFIEGYARETAKHAGGDLRAHMTELHTRAKAALDATTHKGTQ